MIKVIRILTYFVIIPLFISFGVFHDFFKSALGSVYGSTICLLLFLPTIISGISFVIGQSNSINSKLSFYFIGCVFILFGYATLYEVVSENNFNKRIYWENVELSDVPRENTNESIIRNDRLMSIREYKLMEVEAKDLELRAKNEGYSTDSWILIITGLLLIILNYLIYKNRKSKC